MSDRIALLLLLLTLSTLAGCRPIPESELPAAPQGPGFHTNAPETPGAINRSEVPSPATPISDQPAAGVCADTQGTVVTVTIYPDIPDPRCAILAAEQQVKIANRREETIQVRLAGSEIELAPGAEHTYHLPAGRMLAKGVHLLQVSPCCSAELWLQ